MIEDHPQRELLLRYVDKQLDTASEKQVTELLEIDSEAREYVSYLENSDLPYDEAFEPLLRSNISNEVIQKIEQFNLDNHRFDDSNKKGIWQGIAAGLVVGSICTALAINSIKFERTPDLVTSVSQYQSLYQRATVLSSGKPDLNKLNQTIESEFGHAVDIPDLSELNYKFIRGQLLQTNGKPLIQLVYLAETGVPLALCFTRSESTEINFPTFGESFGLNYSHWTSNDLEFVLVGDSNVSLEELTKLAFPQLGT